MTFQEAIKRLYNMKDEINTICKEFDFSDWIDYDVEHEICYERINPLIESLEQQLKEAQNHAS